VDDSTARKIDATERGAERAVIGREQLERGGRHVVAFINDDKPVGRGQLRDVVATKRPGDEITLELYRGSLPGRLMPNLVSAMAERPELARAVREGFLIRRRLALTEVLRRGVDRGDLRPDIDLELALDVLGGPLFYRLLITGGPIDEPLAEGVTQLILRGFAPDKPGRATSKRTAREHS